VNENMLIALIQFALQFGLDAALGLAKAAKNNSLDDAIAALEKAKTKTAEDYLKEAAAQPAGVPGSGPA